MDDLLVSDLLSSEEGFDSLRHGGDHFSLYLREKISSNASSPTSSSKTIITKIANNIIDLGLIERDKLEYDGYIPTGYETIDDKLMRQIRFSCSMEFAEIMLDSNEKSPKSTHKDIKTPFIPKIVVLEHDFYPRKTESSQPSYHLEFERTDDRNDGVITLYPGMNQTLNISININDNYDGSIEKWIILTLKHFDQPIRTCIQESTFLMAFQLKGSVISSDSKNKLSSDAIPFVPTHLKEYFNFDVSHKLYCTNRPQVVYTFSYKYQQINIF